MVFNSFPTFEGVVAWEHLIHLFSLLGQQRYIDQLTLTTFKTFDLNHDGCLSIAQFCNFASQTSEIFELLYKFRIHLMINFLQSSSNEAVPSKSNVYITKSFMTILNRKKNLSIIKDYMENTDGKLPESNCGSKMKYFFTNKPNPNQFDYDCNISDISFTDLTIIMIKKYKSNFMFEKEGFSMKYLSSFTTYKEIVDIDKYYVTYRTQLPFKSPGYTSRPGSMSATPSPSVPKGRSILKTSMNIGSTLLKATASRNNSLLIVVKPHRSSLSMSAQMLKRQVNTTTNNKTKSSGDMNQNLRNSELLEEENTASDENTREGDNEFINVL